MEAGSCLTQTVERDGAVRLLKLARPKANLVDAEMIAALGAALSDAQKDRALKAVVLGHEGPHFSFGASVQEHLPEQCAAMLRGLHALVLRMVDFPVPLLCAVSGQCLGGGLEVASAAHLLFLKDDAKLGQPELNLGVFAPAASCLLPERIGPGAADELLWSGRSIDAPAALKLGLAQDVSADPLKAALDWFDAHLKGKSASSLRYAVTASRCDLRERVHDKLTRVEKLYLEQLMATHDAREGLNAFLEKRAPRWEVRPS